MERQNHFEIGKDLYEKGKYKDAYQELQSAYKQAKSGGAQGNKSDNELAEICYELGRAYRQLAKYPEAEHMLKDANALFEKGDTKNLDGSARALKELGHVYFEQSKFTESEEVLMESLKIRQGQFSEPHEEIAGLLNSLGLWAWRKGDNEAAHGYYERALDMYRKTVGENNKEYADTLDDMGIIYQRQDLLEKAEQAHRKSLEIRTACLGPDHPELGYSYSNLAISVHRQGREEQCKEWLERAIQLRENAVGTEHPATATVISNLGMFHLKRGDVKEATQCFERALAIKEKVLGPDNPANVVTLKNLAVAYSRQKMTEKMKELDRKNQAIMRKKIQENEKDVDTMILLADSYAAEQKPEEAKLLLKHALEVTDSDAGPQSPKAAHILRLLAGSEWQDSEVCKGYYLRILSIEKKEFGRRHARVAKTLRDIGTCFGRQNDFETSRLLESQAKAIEFELGKEDPHVAAMVKMYERMSKLKGEKDPATVHQLKLLAHTYARAGKIEEAEATDKRFWELKEEISGSDSEEFADELQEAGMMDSFRNEHAMAVDRLNRALRIKEGASARDENEIAKILSLLSRSYAELGDRQEAKKMAEKGITILQANHGEKHWSLKPSLLALKKLSEDAGDRNETEALELRLQELLPPDPVEQAAAQKKEAEKRMKRMTNAMAGLTALLNDAAGNSETTDIVIEIPEQPPTS
jgi:tetratricopeptide (TPR) repeat protein